MAHETQGKHKETYLGKQKNVGVKTMEIAALNKSERFGKGPELLRETNKSQSDTKETGAQNNTKPLEKAWN